MAPAARHTLAMSCPTFYKLRDRVGCCRSGDRLVFLDVRADRYFCLGRTPEQAFDALLAGLPVDPEAVAGLCSAGIIVGADEGRLELCSALPARDALTIDVAAPLTAAFACLVHRAVWAYRIKTRPLAANIDSLVNRRAIIEPRPVEPAEVSALAAAYQRARLWWSEQGYCLSTSFALMADLIDRGFAPTIVFAVRLGPFEAHCWVELEGLLVNETPERVYPFTPIMVI